MLKLNTLLLTCGLAILPSALPAPGETAITNIGDIVLFDGATRASPAASDTFVYSISGPNGAGYSVAQVGLS